MLQEDGGRQRPQTQPQHNQWTWERFCREEAREAASAFLERVRRFKSRHASAKDVHDSTFTNEFSAAFLEESSLLMANQGETVVPSTNGGATFTTSLPPEIHSRVGNGQVNHRDTSRRRPAKSGKSWWNGLFKWSSKARRSRERRSSGSSTNSGSALSNSTNRIQSTGSTKQKKKRRGIRVVKETPLVQLLNLSESEDGMEWSPCKLMLVEQQENYQIEIYCPPKNPMPKMSLFCFLIDEVRSTTPLEMPDSNSCFAIKSQNHGEYVFDVRTEELKEEWVRLVQTYTHNQGTTNNGLLPRSTLPSSHLATLPRPPSSHTSPNRTGASSGLPLDSSPLLFSRTRNNPPAPMASRGIPGHQVGGAVGGVSSTSTTPPGSRHMSLSVPRRMSVMTASVGPSGSEESVLVDMNSFMRNYSVTRSPNRQRKTMSLFLDPSTRISATPTATPPTTSQTSTPNPYVPTHPISTAAATTTTTTTTGPSPAHNEPAAFPYGSPRESPPPLPKRSSRPYSMFVKNTNAVGGGGASTVPTPSSVDVATPTFATSMVGPRPLRLPSGEATPISPIEILPLSATPTESRPLASLPTDPTLPPHPATPTGTRPLPATPSETARFPALPPRSQAPPTGANCRGERPLPPKRMTSHPILELPRSPHDLSGRGNSSPQSPMTLDYCSMSSSTSALHPVSLAAISKQRKPATPTEVSSSNGGLKLLPPRSGGGGRGGNGMWKPRKERKMSAPCLVPDTTDASNRLTPTSPAYVAFNGKEQFLPGVETDSSAAEASLEVSGGSAENRQGLDREGEGDDGPILMTTSSDSRPPLPPPLTSSPMTCDPSRGFFEGEERSNHATLSFPYFSQRSSPPQLQVSPGTTTTTTTRPEHPSSAREEVTREDSVGVEHPDMGGSLVGDDPPPLPARNNSHSPPHTPPLSGGREDVASRFSRNSVSTHSISSLEDRESSLRTDSVTSNPIFVETTEGQGYSQAPPVHTRHPYEFWATNQQDITNLRMLSQYPWFHGMISRNNASQLVVAEGDAGTGQYLVRQSESREGDFVLTFNYHNRPKHLRMTVDSNGCNIQHLWFDSVPCMLDYFKTNSIPLESFWLNDDVKLTTYIDRQASDAFRTTNVLNVEQLNRIPPRRSRSLHLGMSRAVGGGGGGGSAGSSHPSTPIPGGGLVGGGERGGGGGMEHSRGSSASSASLPHAQSAGTGWRQIFRSQRSSSAGNVGRVQRSHSHNAGSIQATAGRTPGGVAVGGGGFGQRSNRENAYVWRNY